jgi:hypothetical protein
MINHPEVAFLDAMEVRNPEEFKRTFLITAGLLVAATGKPVHNRVELRAARSRGWPASGRVHERSRVALLDGRRGGRRLASDIRGQTGRYEKTRKINGADAIDKDFLMRKVRKAIDSIQWMRP